ncbi:SIMPL domain-containing protein [Spirilliplanes yamanashiensis]|uniref:SIMPL domain-containing protein n=1 Tax=Spirilliplanes yamanashiensis TaxID=42233 RepID=A0A8J3Y3X8_9ACTN|nr:SIMPL domain-containing protein [Spirilliplanes yamanashiensis]MDP9814050.1 uncharacterized protein YggE [Spirilliplanes yamanashiensis]GIJ00970.1 hypothetical protein Sya03_03220 [Spirilliplanes yamanashiensis]
MEPAVVRVRGEAQLEVPPELARFAVSVSARGKDRQGVLTRLAERSAAVRALVDEYPDAVDRRETGAFHLSPELKRTGERIAAYTGSVTTTVTVTDFTVLGELMVRLADLEQSAVDGPWWELRPGNPAAAEARRAALADALTRAREYAAAVGARVDRLVEISDEGGGGFDRPMFRAMAGAAESAGLPSFDLDPQVQAVHAAVQLRLTITEPELG